MDKFKSSLSRRAFLFTALSGLVALLAPRTLAATLETPAFESYPPLPTRGEAFFQLKGCKQLRRKFGGAC